ncbi:hypothetical protein [Sporomusa acidovorans]|uniref:DUF2325 domain-containing protein n=1 Tax=Sporomusa acidovorans (strain ATCC 49682 / DSM 3132 / Mol) TaxID=1123286 RepID=A0ABZ3J4N0_SPOA4|nr:hypothetical protein [Sporomusa acidovorans]OZC23940.1 hypothetical protein SPACI_03580 [Sporomusa acidovorans DSM 3132]SDF31687.1 hypothetical protein SAMN04488499_104328 [Sporomusa acidovorans]
MQQQQQICLDLVPFMARGIAQNKAARQELDKICAGGGIMIDSAVTPRRRAYGSYFREKDVFTELYCQKATDLIVTSFQENENGRKAAAAFEQLLKKCWRAIYNYVKTSGREVPFESFWQFLMKQEPRLTARELRNLPAPPVLLDKHRRPLKPHINSKDMLDGDFAIFWYLVNVFGKTLTEQGPLFHSNFQAHLRVQEKMTGDRQAPVLTDRQAELADMLWQSIDQRLKGIPASLDEYFHTLEYTRTAGYLFKRENFGGLPFDAIARAPVSRRELRRAIETMAAALSNETQATAELKQAALDFFTRTLLIRACAAEYDKLRTFVLRESRREGKTAAKRLQADKLKAELAQAQKEIATWKEKLAEKQVLLNELQLKIDKTEMARQKERDQWEAKLDESSQALDKLLASPNQENEAERERELSPEAVEAIARLNVVIIGGRSDWQQRLKEKYPRFAFISPAEAKYDLAVLAAADAIVICWKCLGHSLFYRTVGYAGKYHKPIVYFGSSNEQQLLRLLQRKCLPPGKEERHRD